MDTTTLRSASQVTRDDHDRDDAIESSVRRGGNEEYRKRTGMRLGTRARIKMGAEVVTK